MIFGDADPEDAWDAADPVAVKVHNLARRMVLLDAGPLEDELEAIADRLAIWYATRHPRSELERVRAELIADDLEALDRG